MSEALFHPLFLGTSNTIFRIFVAAITVETIANHHRNAHDIKIA